MKNIRFEKKTSFILLIVFIFLLWSSFASARSGRAQSPFQVGLVVQLNNQTITRCVTLSKANPNGYDVLQASGLDLITSASGMGVTICSIAGTGCPANDCFCMSYSPPYYYWSYWHLQNGQWIYSNLGASNYIVAPNAVEGWVWGDGKTTPSVVEFSAICPSGTVTPPPSSTPSATPLPSLTTTATPISTSGVIRKTKLPTATALPATSISPSPSPVAQILATSTPNPLAVKTPTLTPSITLAYALLSKATFTPTTEPTPLHLTNAPEELDLQSLSLTATAMESLRRITETPSASHTTLSSLIKTGFFAFLVMAVFLFIILLAFLFMMRK
ncbi:MAG: hypothetical protein ACPL3P_04880 [Anaerolineales bacterium]